MNISDYFSVAAESSHDVYTFTEQQGSDFAKGVAGDFNPIHDIGSKRFCVPGDLLFSLMLHRFGMATETKVSFAGMLGADSSLTLPASVQDSLTVVDSRDREVLSLEMTGTRYNDPQLIHAITTAYVGFSGKTFPDILVPLMHKSNAMINPARPLVIYKDMCLNLSAATDGVDVNTISLELADTELTADGRKGDVRLEFSILADNQSIGKGTKNMILSGLREFDEEAMQGIVNEYNTRRSNY